MIAESGFAGRWLEGRRRAPMPPAGRRWVTKKEENLASPRESRADEEE